MQTSPLHPDFGLIVHDINLSDVTANHLWPEIRHAFETHSALLFPKQVFDDETHLKIANLFGPIENREAMSKGKDMPFEIPAVSNETKSGVKAKAQGQGVMVLEGQEEVEDKKRRLKASLF